MGRSGTNRIERAVTGQEGVSVEGGTGCGVVASALPFSDAVTVRMILEGLYAGGGFALGPKPKRIPRLESSIMPWKTLSRNRMNTSRVRRESEPAWCVVPKRSQPSWSAIFLRPP